MTVDELKQLLPTTNVFTISFGDKVDYKKSKLGGSFYWPTKTGPTRFETASYKGNIKIIDKELALDLLINGLGRLKNYGCGLLLVK